MLQRFLQFKKHNAYLYFLRYLSHFLNFKKNLKKQFIFFFDLYTEAHLYE